MRDLSLSLLLALAVIPSGAPAQPALRADREGRPLQLGTIAGTVTAVATGAPLVRATVTVIGTQVSAQTDADGRYTLTAVPVGTHRLRARMLGYAPEDTSVLVEDGRESVVNFQLQARAFELEAVVAVGYGTQTRASVTGSVATVTSADLVKTPAVTTSGALVGRIPGVLTRGADGRPGSSTTIQIRNLGTPLFVIDGIPKDEGQFNNIDANDIESITVLKDASAAAVYGVRAANGVVLVTTKKGARGQENRINIRTYSGWQNMFRFPRAADAATYVRAQIESDMNLNGWTTWTPEELAKWEAGTEKGYRGFDWYDFAVRGNAPQQYVSASTTGGSDRLNYYVSLARLNQQATFLKGYFFDRSNIQANVDAQISERLKVGAQINGRIEKRRNPGNPGVDDYWMVLFGTYRNRPTERPYANDNPRYPAATSHGASNHATLNYDISGFWESTWRVQQTNVSAEYQLPLAGLTATGRYSYYLADNTENTFEYTYDLYTYDETTDTYRVTGGNQNPYRDRWNRKVEENFFQLQLNYDRSFGLHGVSADLAFEANERFEPRYWFRSQPTTNYLDLVNFNELKAFTDQEDESARMGYVLRANYSYDDRYLLQLAGRYDASWKFSPEKRWGLFPSAAAGWRVSSESFYENSGIKDVLSELKLRASYGEVGDDNVGIGPFDYLTGYDFRSGSAVLNGELITGIRPRGLPITNISWLTSTMTNIGLDFGLWNSVLSGSVEYFYRKRAGLRARRWDVLMPEEVAIYLPDENLNADAHMGVEGALSYAGTAGENLHYSVGGNVTVARQRDLYTYKPRFGNSWDRYRRSIEDRWAYINWGYQVIGQFQSQEEIDNYPVDIDGRNNTTLLPGDFIYRDVNGDGIINGLDERPIGYRQGALPYVSFGFQTSLSYKGVDLGLNFAGAAMQSYEREWEIKIPFQNDANSPTYLFEDRWHRQDLFDPDSPWVPGTYPALRKGMVNHSNMRRSDFWVEKVNYLRLKTVEVGFTLPTDWLNRLRVHRARVYVNGTNLFSLDNLAGYGLDPEVAWGNGLQYPPTRLINVGADLSF